MSETSFSESLSIDDLKHIANEYERLVLENADLIQFKEVALKNLTKDQLEAIEDEIEEMPEASY